MGYPGLLQGYGEGTRLVAAGVRWGVRGHQKGVKRKAENTVITHPGLFLSGPLAAGGRDQLGFVAASRVIQWWSRLFFYNGRSLSRPHTKPLRGKEILSLTLSPLPLGLKRPSQARKRKSEK